MVDPLGDSRGDSSAATVLALAGVSFGYSPRQPVINDFTASLPPGRVCALIGPNAAGKTTLLRLMLGQLKPWSGAVTLEGRCVQDLDSGLRAAAVGYVPQRGSASFAFTVEQVVAMGRFALSQDRTAVERAIAQCDLTPVRHRVFNTLSAGQQQRVLLARAIAQVTGAGRAMLLDEPGSTMDLWHLHQTMQRLKSLAEDGLAVLVVLHDLNLAARYADLVWLVDGGQLVVAGPWSSVLRPEILEPVYRVRVTALAAGADGRPVFGFEPKAIPSDKLQ